MNLWQCTKQNIELATLEHMEGRGEPLQPLDGEACALSQLINPGVSLSSVDTGQRVLAFKSLII